MLNQHTPRSYKTPDKGAYSDIYSIDRLASREGRGRNTSCSSQWWPNPDQVVSPLTRDEISERQGLKTQESRSTKDLIRIMAHTRKGNK